MELGRTAASLALLVLALLLSSPAPSSALFRSWGAIGESRPEGWSNFRWAAAYRRAREAVRRGTRQVRAENRIIQGAVDALKKEIRSKRCRLWTPEGGKGRIAVIWGDFTQFCLRDDGCPPKRRVKRDNDADDDAEDDDGIEDAVDQGQDGDDEDGDDNDGDDGIYLGGTLNVNMELTPVQSDFVNKGIQAAKNDYDEFVIASVRDFERAAEESGEKVTRTQVTIEQFKFDGQRTAYFYAVGWNRSLKKKLEILKEKFEGCMEERAARDKLKAADRAEKEKKRAEREKKREERRAKWEYLLAEIKKKGEVEVVEV
ncbi:hypothetical protein DFJ74DRAFT_774263 [Hyaloraphidium curvatum]|nr:hypothetical protein DFJ74DRAFT_774263 [Hyaloraphidium curvatum]